MRRWIASTMAASSRRLASGTAAMKSATDTSVALVLISALAMAFLPGADDSPRAAGRQAGCTFSGSLLAAPASFPRQRCIMSESFKRVVLAYSGGLDTSVILKWLQVTYGCEVVTFKIGRASCRERVCQYV